MWCELLLMTTFVPRRVPIRTAIGCFARKPAREALRGVCDAVRYQITSDRVAIACKEGNPREQAPVVKKRRCSRKSVRDCGTAGLEEEKANRF